MLHSQILSERKTGRIYFEVQYEGAVEGLKFQKRAKRTFFNVFWSQPIPNQ